MNINEALSSLDPANDEHWTADGLPRMDAVQALVGSSDITREDVTNAAPDLTRETSAQKEMPDVEAHPEVEATPEAAGEVVGEVTDEPRVEVEGDVITGDPADDWHPDPEPEDEDDAPPSIPAPTPTPPTPEPEPVHVETAPPTETELLQERLDDLTVQMLAAQRDQEEAKREAARLADEVNTINRQMDQLIKHDPNHGTAGTRAYLKKQNELRIERGKRLERFTKAVDVHPQEFMRALDPRTPIDRAMQGRKPPRGTRRPHFPPAVRTG